MRLTPLLIVTVFAAGAAASHQVEPHASLLPYGFHFGDAPKIVAERLLSTEEAAAKGITSFRQDGNWITASAKSNGEFGTYFMRMGFEAGGLVEIQESIQGATYEKCFAVFGNLLNLARHRPTPNLGDQQEGMTLVGGDGRRSPFLYKAADTYEEVQSDVTQTTSRTCSVSWRYVDPRYWARTHDRK